MLPIFFLSLINDALNVINGINHVDTAFADGLMIAREQPAVAIGFSVFAALLVLPGPRRFLSPSYIGSTSE